MATIPIPPNTPLWEHPSTKIQCLSMWKQQVHVMYDLTDAQRALNKKLKNPENNLIMYAHLGTEAIRPFEYSPAMGQIQMMPHNKFYSPIVAMFEQPTPQPISFYQFRTCKQCRDESTSEFLSWLPTLQEDCKYDNFNADTDLAYMLAQNCYSQETQTIPQLWSRSIAELIKAPTITYEVKALQGLQFDTS
uniref:Uncharacterized protein n=1 Tax=Romanomermis culicivorax TaxID=13658 RepID=A0A915KLU4_ROMCU